MNEDGKYNFKVEGVAAILVFVVLGLGLWKAVELVAKLIN